MSEGVRGRKGKIATDRARDHERDGEEGEGPQRGREKEHDNAAADEVNEGLLCALLTAPSHAGHWQNPAVAASV